VEPSPTSPSPAPLLQADVCAVFDGPLELHAVSGLTAAFRGGLTARGAVRDCELEVDGVMRAASAIGGCLTARGRVELDELGDPAGTPTEVVLETPAGGADASGTPASLVRARRVLAEEERALERTRERIERVEDGRAEPGVEARKAMALEVFDLPAAVEALETLRGLVARAGVRFGVAPETASVRVGVRVHPGVTVRVAGADRPWVCTQPLAGPLRLSPDGAGGVRMEA